MVLRPTTFRLETEITDALNDIRERDGIPVSEQVRRALKRWIEEKSAKKAERKRPASRKRS